ASPRRAHNTTENTQSKASTPLDRPRSFRDDLLKRLPSVSGVLCRYSRSVVPDLFLNPWIAGEALGGGPVTAGGLRPSLI
ncbi:hypothetical protein, partial [Micromonospora sp. NPDC005806]|uniref:hypothetical protein n=1 Tax=Micromonospora sp. NPDC005806 TaxID=3364234 RepID=UPI0036BDA921